MQPPDHSNVGTIEKILDTFGLSEKSKKGKKIEEFKKLVHSALRGNREDMGILELKFAEDLFDSDYYEKLLLIVLRYRKINANRFKINIGCLDWLQGICNKALKVSSTNNPYEFFKSAAENDNGPAIARLYLNDNTSLEKRNDIHMLEKAMQNGSKIAFKFFIEKFKSEEINFKLAKACYIASHFIIDEKQKKVFKNYLLKIFTVIQNKYDKHKKLEEEEIEALYYAEAAHDRIIKHNRIDSVFIQMTVPKFKILYERYSERLECLLKQDNLINKNDKEDHLRFLFEEKIKKINPNESIENYRECSL